MAFWQIQTLLNFLLLDFAAFVTLVELCSPEKEEKYFQVKNYTLKE